MKVKTIDKRPEIVPSLGIILLLIQIAVVPLVVYLKLIPVSEEAIDFWNSNTNWDFFSYYKSSMTSLIAALLAILMIKGLAARKISIKGGLIRGLLLIYAASILVSALFSKYPATALSGFPDRYEGLFLLLSYIGLLAASWIFITNKKSIKALLTALFVSAAIIGTIGILQFFEYDLFKTSLGQALIIPSEYLSQKSSILFQADRLGETKHVIYSTLYNPNALGQYMAMVFSISVLLCIFTTNIYYQAALGALSCLVFANLMGSLSRGSYTAVFISLAVTFAVFAKQLPIRWKALIPLALICLLIYIGMNGLDGGGIQSRLQTIISKTDNHAEDRSIDKIKNFTMEGSKLDIVCTNSTLKVSVQDGRILFADLNNKALNLRQVGSQGRYEIADVRYSEYSLYLIDNLIKVQKGKSFLYFAIVDNQFRFLDHQGKVQVLGEAAHIGFQGIERVGSGRGYIWSRTLPLIKYTFLLGAGPDAFAMKFPQEDYLGKLNYMYDAYLIIDKPHNMYLQTAVNTGVLSLLALLGIFIAYLGSTVKALRHRASEDFCTKTGIAVFAGLLAYMISGLFTDSTVSVAPVFWILLGVGMKITSKN